MIRYLLLFILYVAKFTRAQDCTFSVKEIPKPENPIIFGDPRKVEECQKTSFDENKPPNLFNPDGLRMWSREENTMSTSSDPLVQVSLFNATTTDPYFFYRYNWLIYKEGEASPLLNIRLNLKSGSMTIRTLFGFSSDRYMGRDEHRNLLSDFTITSVRHPITRLLSSLRFFVYDV